MEAVTKKEKARLVKYIRSLEFPPEIEAKFMCEAMDGMYVPIHKYNDLLAELERVRAEIEAKMEAEMEQIKTKCEDYMLRAIKAEAFIEGWIGVKSKTSEDDCKVINMNQ